MATAVPDEVAGLLGPDLVAAIEACAVEGLADPWLRERHSITLRRLVHRHHSVYENLAALAATRGHAVSASPSVSILMATNRPEMVTFAIKQMAAQQYPNVEILCGLHGFSLPAGTREHVADDRAARAAVRCRHGPRSRPGPGAVGASGPPGTFVTKWDDDDWYATEHLLDLVAAMRYSRASVVAKTSEYVYLSSLDLTLRRFPTGAETFSTTIAGGTLMLTRSMLQAIGGWPAGPRRVDRLLIGAIEAAGGTIYRMHGFGYLLRRDSYAVNHTWKAEDDYFPRPSRRPAAGPRPAFRRSCRMNSIHGNDWSALVPPAGATWTPTRRVSICIPAHNPANLRRVLDAVSAPDLPKLPDGSRHRRRRLRPADHGAR